jgi:DNA-binding transcriptional LysR family regulator
MVTGHLVINRSRRGRTVKKTERGVQQSDTPAFFANLDKVNWDDVYLFRTVAEAESLRKASTQLGMSVNTLRNRVARLEGALETLLVARTKNGLALTEEGRAVLDIASEVKALGTRLKLAAGNNALNKADELSICVSEGVGAFWLTPRIASLRTRLSGMTVALRNSLDQHQIHSSDCDLKIGYVRPTDPDSIVTKLATVHFVLCASDEYLRINGVPTSFDDTVNHAYIDQDSPGLGYDAVRMFVGSSDLKGLVVMRVNSSFSLFWAVANGQGIGALPSYVRVVSKRIRTLPIPLRLKFELWLSYDRALKQSRTVQTGIEWLRECFDSKKYPWFSDTFIDPADFEHRVAESRVVSLFDFGIGEY